MKEMFKEYKEIIEELHDRGIGLLELEIWDEIDCQLNGRELSENELSILYCTVERAYLKSEYVSLFDLVKYCIKNLDKIYDMSIYDIIDNCLGY